MVLETLIGGLSRAQTFENALSYAASSADFSLTDGLRVPFETISRADRMMKDEKQVENSYHRLATTKLFGWMEAQTQPKEKEVTPEE